MIVMTDEDLRVLPLTSRAVCRRLTAAVWWSALAWPLLALAVTPFLLWRHDIIDELTTAQGGSRSSANCLRRGLPRSSGRPRSLSARSSERSPTRHASSSSFTTLKDNQAELSRVAHDFGTALMSAYGPFNTRLLPRRAVVTLAGQVSHEAEAEGLKPLTVKFVQELARMTP